MASVTNAAEQAAMAQPLIPHHTSNTSMPRYMSVAASVNGGPAAVSAPLRHPPLRSTSMRRRVSVATALPDSDQQVSGRGWNPWSNEVNMLTPAGLDAGVGAGAAAAVPTSPVQGGRNGGGGDGVGPVEGRNQRPDSRKDKDQPHRTQSRRSAEQRRAEHALRLFVMAMGLVKYGSGCVVTPLRLMHQTAVFLHFLFGIAVNIINLSRGAVNLFFAVGWLLLSIVGMLLWLSLRQMVDPHWSTWTRMLHALPDKTLVTFTR